MPRSKLLLTLVGSALLLCAACGTEDDPTAAGTPASRCEKVCTACSAELKEGATVAGCTTECVEEYRAKAEQESCLDSAITCPGLRACGDFW